MHVILSGSRPVCCISAKGPAPPQATWPSHARMAALNGHTSRFNSISRSYTKALSGDSHLTCADRCPADINSAMHASRISKALPGSLHFTHALKAATKVITQSSMLLGSNSKGSYIASTDGCAARDNVWLLALQNRRRSIASGGCLAFAHARMAELHVISSGSRPFCCISAKSPAPPQAAWPS